MTKKELKVQIEKTRESLELAISKEETEEKILRISVLLDHLIADYYKLAG